MRMGRKEEIIYATLELASENGLRSVSMSQIAEKVGIKAPSIYNHFKSKDDIVKEMYSFLREKAGSGNAPASVDFAKAFDGKTLEEILLGSLSSYMGIISDKNMLLFFKLLYSERSINPLAAEILVEETDRMIQSTKNFFYALVVHGKMKNESIDTAATAYALTIHSLIDYRMDMMTAGVVKKFGEGKSPVPKEITDYIKWFSNLEELK